MAHKTTTIILNNITMIKLINRNITANKKRGRIKPIMKGIDWLNDIHEEHNEVIHEYYTNGETDHLADELGDEIMVRFSWLVSMGFNPIDVINRVVIKNETRND